jgi:SAM-dependent methyltransferase
MFPERGRRRRCEDSAVPESTPQPGWLLDELAHAGLEHLDPAYVAEYDRKSPTDWTEDIRKLQAMGIGAQSTVVDLGAGTGQFALAIAPYVRRVIAVDVSAPMVGRLRERGIEGVHAGFLTYDHSGDPADAVVTRNALHHLPDFWKALALSRIAEMLSVEGVLVVKDLVFSFDPGEAKAALECWFSSAPGDPAQGWTADELAEHVRTEYSTFTWLFEPMLERAGFDIREKVLSENKIFAAYFCVRR